MNRIFLRSNRIVCLWLIAITCVACNLELDSPNTNSNERSEQSVRFPKQSTVDFSLSSNQEFLPTIIRKDILDEVSFFASGGGGLTWMYCVNENGNNINIVSEVPKVEFTDGVNAEINIDRPLSISIIFPNGDILTKQFSILTSFDYYVDFQSPIGAHTVLLTDGIHKQYCYFDVQEPILPRLYPGYGGYFDFMDNLSPHLVLFGFEPNEKVCLFSYADKRLVAWQSFQVDGKGNLMVNLVDMIELRGESIMAPKTEFMVVAVGNETGEVYPYEYSDAYGDRSVVSTHKSIITRKSDFVEVKSPADIYHIYSEPSSDSVRIGTTSAGQQLVVLEKRITISGEVWWRIQMNNIATEAWVHNSILSHESTGSADACPLDLSS